MTDMSKIPKPHLLVLTFSALFAMSCMICPPANASSQPDVDLTGTYWKLDELNGQPATLGAGKKELHMILSSDGNKVSGFSGCNRFMGGYSQDNKHIQFGPLAGTMMACMEAMEQEYTFLRTLESSKRFSISGEELTLYGADDQLILRFESVSLK